MLAQQGAGVAQLEIGLRETGRRARLAQPPGQRMVVFDDRAVGGDLGVADHGVAGGDRRAGNAGRLQPGEPVGTGGGAQHPLRHRQAKIDMAMASGGGAEALVVEPLRLPQGMGQRPPFLVLLHRHGDMAVFRLVDEVDEALRRLLGDAAIRHGLALHVGRPQEGDGAVQHGEADGLAFARPLAVIEGGADRLRGDDAGELVGQDGAHQARARPVGAGLHRGQSRKRLHQRVVGRAPGIGAGEAEARDGGIDDPRRAAPGRRLADPQPLRHAGAEILHQHVGALDQGEQRFEAGGVLEVDGDGTLVAVVVEEGGSEAPRPGRDAAGVVAAGRGVLHLDDVGTLVGQHHGGRRPGDHAGKIDDANAVQRAGHGGLPERQGAIIGQTAPPRALASPPAGG